MWFIVLVALVQGVEQPKLSSAMATPHFQSHAACMASAARRSRALASVNIHGQYLCMYHDESDAELARTAKPRF